MKAIICDVCKHSVSPPEKGRNYFHIGDRELCESCKDQFDLTVKPVVRNREPFNYEWFNQFEQETIEKAIQKSKF